eukprot:2594315-Rhodomonas_salina.1
MTALHSIQGINAALHAGSALVEGCIAAVYADMLPFRAATLSPALRLGRGGSCSTSEASPTTNSRGGAECLPPSPKSDVRCRDVRDVVCCLWRGRDVRAEKERLEGEVEVSSALAAIYGGNAALYGCNAAIYGSRYLDRRMLYSVQN